MENRNPSARAPQGKAIRLTFSYEGEKITLIDRTPVDKPVPPSAPLLDTRPRGQSEQGANRPTGQSGFWVELHGRQGRAVYRHVMSNPIEHHAEVPDEEGGFTNVTRKNPRGVFFVVVPDLPDAESVVLFSSPLRAEAKLAPAEPVARFPLRARKEG